MCRNKNNVGCMQIADPLVVVQQMSVDPEADMSKIMLSRPHGPDSLGDFTLNGAVTFQRNFGNLLEFEPVLFFKLLKR